MIMLVHGACHGAWCWDRVAPLLAEAGYAVIAPDLPGRAGHGRPGWHFDLKDYAASITGAAKEQSAPVIAVGHSMGGMVIAAAAEAAPDLFNRLVFLSAFMPIDGDSLASIAAMDKHSDLGGATRLDLLKGIVTIKPARLGPVYCGDCSDAAIASAQARIGPESVRPSLTKVRLTEERFGAVPRSYIRCTRDRALSVQLQDQLVARQPCDRVATLDASHSPFLSMPAPLARAILSVI
jgi:pimeloyl-ACP methyl ester carboxylesterase